MVSAAVGDQQNMRTGNRASRYKPILAGSRRGLRPHVVISAALVDQKNVYSEEKAPRYKPTLAILRWNEAYDEVVSAALVDQRYSVTGVIVCFRLQCCYPYLVVVQPSFFFGAPSH
jgi:hypothetical protein